METGETKRSPGYGKPPWVFRGSALYQLHLVRAETARALIPKEFRLVEAFGYTLGGFFLASYEDSPAGVFDELVVIAGTVWNPPTSCAWAAKVLVNSDEACRHGQKDVGLPSQVASFSKRRSPAPLQPFERQNRFLDILGIGTSCPPNQVEVSVSDPTAANPCHLSLVTLGNLAFCAALPPAERVGKWKGPPVKMWLPSFSGRTDHNPNLLKYSCQIECRVRAVSPAEVKLSPREGDVEGRQQDDPEDGSYRAMEPARGLGRDPSLSVMLSKPILALKFSCLRMQVEAPVVISHC